MITAKEIRIFSEKLGVPARTIDKDWVLGHLHPYSDRLPGLLIPCYSIEEIISEKFRALLQRHYAAPRDYYDLWYIINHIDAILWEYVVKAFREKCDYKNISHASAQDFFVKNKMVSCKKEWVNSLNHHLKTVPPFDDVIADLKEQTYKYMLVGEH
jgi:predicted nucleotidyltransferase component of viral defense system